MRLTDERPKETGCPHDEVCERCPCSRDDDVCFPGERLRAERDTNEMRATMAEEVAADLQAQRDHWIRLFNRLDAAVNHHNIKRCSGHEGFGPDENDDALYAAQQRILRAAAEAES